MWNQPISDYRVVSKREISRDEAERLMKVGSDRQAPFSPQAVKFVRVNTVIHYMM